MRLLRVQVPDFRVLKNIDISFEKDFFPNIFPLGSQNGGGKSTLLQLIFILLHCSGDPDKAEFIQNLLDRFDVDDETGERTLAIFDIWDGEKIVKLTFWVSRTRRGPKIVNTQNQTIDNLIAEYESNDTIRYSLYCRFKGIGGDRIDGFFKNLSSKIYLACPPTQIFLFLNKEINKKIFKVKFIENENNDNPKVVNTEDQSEAKYKYQFEYNYQLAILEARLKLKNFFVYDFFNVNLLINSFKESRDQDFRQAIRTGQYGNSYQVLLDNLNKVLGNKTVNIDENLTEVHFKLADGENGQELYPEDLSHGELKRLSIYVWLKYRKIEDAIVLMDEIEIAFHPEWQYKIVEDLQEWEPSNQYILATHSYDICQGLTPAHVKEIEPKLLPTKTEKSS